MKSEIYVLYKKIRKKTKKLREKQKPSYSDYILISEFRICSSCNIYLFSISRLKNYFFKVWWRHSDVMACCSSLGNGYFVLLNEYPLRNNNQQSNLPREKSQMFSNRDLSITPWKRLKTFCFTDVFSGYRNEALALNRLILSMKHQLNSSTRSFPLLGLFWINWQFETLIFETFLAGNAKLTKWF